MTTGKTDESLVAKRARLKRQVIEAAKGWNRARVTANGEFKDANEYQARFLALSDRCGDLTKALNALESFEAKQKK